MKAPALRGVCLRERRGDDSATNIIPLGGLVHSLILVISSTPEGRGKLEPSPGPQMHHDHRRGRGCKSAPYRSGEGDG